MAVPSDRAKHIARLARQLKAQGIEKITLTFKDGSSIPLSQSLLLDFIFIMRGNKVDALMGSWLASLKEALRAAKGEAS